MGMVDIWEGRGRRDEKERGGADSLGREPAIRCASDSFSITTQPHYAAHRHRLGHHSILTLPRCPPPPSQSLKPNPAESRMERTLSPRPGRSGEPSTGGVANQRLFVHFSFSCLSPTGRPEGPRRGGTLHGGRRARVCELTMPISSYSISAVRVRCMMVALRVRVRAVAARIVRSLRLVVPVRVSHSRQVQQFVLVSPMGGWGRIGNERSSVLFCFAGAGE